MASSLSSALSGLQVHQSWIDLIGNNLANSNTPGFKTSSATFSDQFSRTLRYASGPGTGLGGRNPVQVGLGVQLADIGRNFAQGALTSTGRTFDLALQGHGFFTVSNGSQDFYTRVGTFGLDSVHDLVDQRTGYRVLDSSGSPISIDTDTLLAPSATGSMEFTGNLPALVTGPLPEVLTGATGFREGSSATLTGTATGPFAIPVGETWTMDVVVSGGAPQTASITSATGTVTAAEIAAEIDALDEVSATVDVTGHVVVTSDRTGEDVSVKINPGAAGRDLSSLVGISTVLVTGSEISVTSTTTLNQLPGNVRDYADGDVIHVSGVDADGSAVNATFTYGAAGDGTTVEEFVAFLEGQYPGSTVEMNSAGQLVVTSNTPGEADMLMSFSDDASSTGSTQWSLYALSVTTQGTPPDEVSTSMEVYDPAGVAHMLTFTFERQADGTWNATSSMPASEGTVLSPPIEGIRFGDDGIPIGLGALDTTVIAQFTGQSATQSINLDFGGEGDFGGITQYGGDGEVYVREQDGFGVGELASMSVSGSGTIEGFYTNGQTRSLGDIGVATFANPEGLHQVSDNYFAASTNSGSANLGAGASAGSGVVVGGALESSNVDTAEQFVHLIEAQRGFQANARVITAQDEVLRDTVNLI